MKDIDGLLSELAAGAPWLPGALCRGRPHLFDPGEGVEPGREARHAQARGLCMRCPSLDRCRRWLDGLAAERRPSGVIAGQVLGAPPTTSTGVRGTSRRGV